MADLLPQNHLQTPLTTQPDLESGQNTCQQHDGDDDLTTDADLDQCLQNLETFLCLLGFCQTSVFRIVVSWSAFAVVGVFVPIAALEVLSCSGCEHVIRFEVDILVSHACVSAVSLLCVSHNLRKYGLRRFLFVDRYHGHRDKFRKNYIEKIKGFSCLFFCWVSPCFSLKVAIEISRVLYTWHESWWRSILVCLALVVSWSYLIMISLSASVLFNLVCNLQVIHFDDYGKLLETDSEISVYMEEHIRLRHYLSKISHRFRIYLLLEFIFVTASQIVILLQTIGHRGIASFINGGDFVVTSIIQVGGVILCLHAAVKISHRALDIVSVASTWHASVSCNCNDASQLSVSSSMGNFEAAANAVGSLSVCNSESDLDSLDAMNIPTYARVTSYMSTFHKRQAFVMYLQSNPGGITIFGWAVNRTLIDTIFCAELSLVLFVLGKTLVFGTN
ncbi:hypothetical protein Scep_008076 [Stephania cephalantha]|uniref:Uncharacterized protein n=1 Tax=Stephania cephalantha TaxID=152367 RepID=A0AAP0PNU0_9MAGN